MAAVYEEALSRVHVSLSDMPDGVYQVERSTNELYWETVRGGHGLSLTTGSGHVYDYEFPIGAEVFYRVQPQGSPGLILTNEPGSYASTPNHSSLNVPGFLDIRVELTPQQWAAGRLQYLVAKYFTTDNRRQYAFRLASNGRLSFIWSSNGTTFETINSTIPPAVSDGNRLAVRVLFERDIGSFTHRARFYTASSMAGPWHQLGTDITGFGNSSIHSSTTALEVGSHTGGSSGRLDGVVHAVEVRNAETDTLVAAPMFIDQPTGTTSFADTPGRTWTVHSAASIVSVESASLTVDVDDCELWLKSVRYPMLNAPVRVATYTELQQPGRAATFDIPRRSFPVATTDVSGAYNYQLAFHTRTVEEARKLSLSLAVGAVFYLQVPPEGNPRLPPRSMYLVVHDVQIRRLGVEEERHIVATVAERAQPVPQVVGTTLTWGTVWRLYGTWNQLWNGNPSWADLLATVGSPDDLVVM